MNTGKFKITKYSLLLGFGVLCAATLEGCFYDKADQVYPQPPACDTTTVRLSVELESILSANCYRCHNDANADVLGGGWHLHDYTTMQFFALSGELLGAIEQDGSTSPMPKDGGKLSDCDINKFRAWINRGAPQN